jgi:hypothetical protein
MVLAVVVALVLVPAAVVRVVVFWCVCGVGYGGGGSVRRIGKPMP